MKNNDKLVPKADWQTKARGTNDNEYQIYLACADNGKGGDITRNGAPSGVCVMPCLDSSR